MLRPRTLSRPSPSFVSPSLRYRSAPITSTRHAFSTSATPYIVEVSESNYEQLLDSGKPLLLDFMATWCQPCHQLAPLLEKAINEKQGKVILGKVDVDANPVIAEELRVTQLPTVMGIFNKRVVDGWVGVQTYDFIAKVVDRLVSMGTGTDIKSILAAADAELEASNFRAASQVYTDLLQNYELKDAEKAHAYAGLGLVAVASMQVDNAETMLKKATEYDTTHSLPIVVRLKGSAEVAKIGAEWPEEIKEMPMNDMKVLVDRDPSNFDMRYKFAVKCFLEGKRKTALTENLSLIKDAKDWNDDAPRKLV